MLYAAPPACLELLLVLDLKATSLIPAKTLTNHCHSCTLHRTLPNLRTLAQVGPLCWQACFIPRSSAGTLVCNAPVALPQGALDALDAL